MTTSTASHILVGTDGSAPAATAIIWAADEAVRRGIGLRVVVVQEPLEGVFQVATMLQAARDEYSHEVLQAAIAEVAEAHPGLQVETSVAFGYPVPVLGQLAAEAELLVLGSRGRGSFRGLVLGSSSQRLAASSPVPVVVLGPEASEGGGPVVVGVDGSPATRVVLDFAAEYAAGRQCSLLVVQVINETFWYAEPGLHSSHWLDEARQSLTEDLEEHLARLVLRHPEVEVTCQVLSGNPAEVLRDVASEAPMLVVGSRGRGMAGSLVLGSVSHGVLHHAPCPVAVINPSNLDGAAQA